MLLRVLEPELRGARATVAADAAAARARVAAAAATAADDVGGAVQLLADASLLLVLAPSTPAETALGSAHLLCCLTELGGDGAASQLVALLRLARAAAPPGAAVGDALAAVLRGMAQGARTATLCAPVPAGAPPLPPPLDGGARLGAAADGTAEPLLAVVAGGVLGACARGRRRAADAQALCIPRALEALLAHLEALVKGGGALPPLGAAGGAAGARLGAIVDATVDGAVQLVWDHWELSYSSLTGSSRRRSSASSPSTPRARRAPRWRATARQAG